MDASLDLLKKLQLAIDYAEQVLICCTKERGGEIRPLTKRVARIAITYSAYSGRAR